MWVPYYYFKVIISGFDAAKRDNPIIVTRSCDSVEGYGVECHQVENHQRRPVEKPLSFTP
jgi:hypothetical protein